MQHTFLFFSLAEFTILQASSEIINSSESILCLDKSSTSTGLKVPNPTCKVTSAKFIPAHIVFESLGQKHIYTETNQPIVSQKNKLSKDTNSNKAK